MTFDLLSRRGAPSGLWRKFLAGPLGLAVAFLLLVPSVRAQLTTGTVLGTVDDTSNAIVPGAKVTLQNDASGDQRQTVSNGEGYFSFAGVQPGTYTVTVQASGFAPWKQTGFTMNSGDTRQVAGIRLQVGSTATTVDVSASPAQLLPIDSGERSAVISSEDLEKLSLEGRDVSELLKILPGVTQVPSGTNGGNTNVDTSIEGPNGAGWATATRPAALPIGEAARSCWTARTSSIPVATATRSRCRTRT